MPQAYPRRQVPLPHPQQWDTVTSIPSMHSLLSQKHLRWLRVRPMDDWHIPKELEYGQLTIGVKNVERPALWFMEACKCDLKVCEINPNNWEDAASYRNRWRRTVKEGIEKPKQTWNVTRKCQYYSQSTTAIVVTKWTTLMTGREIQGYFYHDFER